MADEQNKQPEEQSGDIFHFCDEKIKTNMINGLRELREASTFCDVAVIVHGKEIKAHKVVLAASIPYFKAHLEVTMWKGQQSDRIELTDEHVSEAATSLLIDFVYSASLPISKDNVQELLETADYLNITSACEACCTFMAKNICIENCIAVLMLADRMNQSQLHKAAEDFIREHIREVLNADDCKQLDVRLWMPILDSEELEFPENNHVAEPSDQEYTLASNLIPFCVDGNLEMLPRLLQSVRLPLVSADHLDSLRELLDQTGVASKDMSVYTSCCDLLNEARDTAVYSPMARNVSTWCRPRRNAGLCYDESRCFASGGQVRPIISRFTDATSHPDDVVTGMTIWVRLWDGRPVVGGLKIYYGNGESTLHGNNTVYKSEENFTLQPHEVIQQVRVRAGWLIDSLEFHTDQGNVYGPYGGSGGSPHRAACPWNPASSFLAGMSGAVVETQGSQSITYLSFRWGYYRYRVSSDSANVIPFGLDLGPLGEGILPGGAGLQPGVAGLLPGPAAVPPLFPGFPPGGAGRRLAARLLQGGPILHPGGADLHPGGAALHPGGPGVFQVPPLPIPPPIIEPHILVHEGNIFDNDGPAPAEHDSVSSSSESEEPTE